MVSREAGKKIGADVRRLRHRPQVLWPAAWFGATVGAFIAQKASEAAMTTFDEREKGYEAQLAYDEELRFRAYVRRNKNLGLWAAGKLGKSGEAADAYAAMLIKTHLEGDGDESVFTKLRADFDAAGLADSDHQIRRQMTELLAQAIREVGATH